MAFKASKARGKRKEPVARGTQLVPNAALKEAYAKKIKTLIDRMVDDYKDELFQGFGHKDVEFFYGEDASTTAIFKRILGRLDRKWRGVFAAFAKTHANWFASKVNTYSSFTVKHSLKSLGLAEPKDINTQNIKETLQATIAENVNLITNIQEDFAKNIEGLIFRSIASDNPEDNSPAVIRELMERGNMTKRRATLIAEDQNSKLYSALNSERMQQNGVELFGWKHSSAGKYPRESHIAREKEDVGYGPGIFRFDSPELWEGPKADRGLPGQAIRCRCRMIPIIQLG
jgi:uncharacterized protein with gpF-like domain